MALEVECPKGHGYVASDIYIDWPVGLPKCPTCRKLMVLDEQNRQLRDSIEKLRQSIDAVDWDGIRQAFEDFVNVYEDKTTTPEYAQKLINAKSWVKKE